MAEWNLSEIQRQLLQLDPETRRALELQSQGSAEAMMAASRQERKFQETQPQIGPEPAPRREAVRPLEPLNAELNLPEPPSYAQGSGEVSGGMDAYAPMIDAAMIALMGRQGVQSGLSQGRQAFGKSMDYTQRRMPQPRPTANPTVGQGGLETRGATPYPGTRVRDEAARMAATAGSQREWIKQNIEASRAGRAEGSWPWAHGTTAERAEAIAQQGFHPTTNIGRQYSYSEFGPNTYYGAPKGSYWHAPDTNSRMATYERTIPFEPTPDARILTIKSDADLGRLSQAAGYGPGWNKAGGLGGKLAYEHGMSRKGLLHEDIFREMFGKIEKDPTGTHQWRTHPGRMATLAEEAAVQKAATPGKLEGYTRRHYDWITGAREPRKRLGELADILNIGPDVDAATPGQIVVMDPSKVRFRPPRPAPGTRIKSPGPGVRKLTDAEKELMRKNAEMYRREAGRRGTAESSEGVAQGRTTVDGVRYKSRTVDAAEMRKDLESQGHSVEELRRQGHSPLRGFEDYKPRVVNIDNIPTGGDFKVRHPERVRRATKFIESGKEMTPPQVGLDADGTIVSISDGVHRIAALRMAGKKQIVVDTYKAYPATSPAKPRTNRGQTPRLPFRNWRDLD